MGSEVAPSRIGPSDGDVVEFRFNV